MGFGFRDVSSGATHLLGQVEPVCGRERGVSRAGARRRNPEREPKDLEAEMNKRTSSNQVGLGPDLFIESEDLRSKIVWLSTNG